MSMFIFISETKVLSPVTLPYITKQSADVYWKHFRINLRTHENVLFRRENSCLQTYEISKFLNQHSIHPFA